MQSSSLIPTKENNQNIITSLRIPFDWFLDDSDEEQFEVGADGKIRLKGGKKKINLDKLTDEDLRRLGIDPTLSKAEIARKLKVGSQRGCYKLRIENH